VQSLKRYLNLQRFLRDAKVATGYSENDEKLSFSGPLTACKMLFFWGDEIIPSTLEREALKKLR
jgi:hypothetical protein